jgi:hypothetical protein
MAYLFASPYSEIVSIQSMVVGDDGFKLAGLPLAYHCKDIGPS